MNSVTADRLVGNDAERFQLLVDAVTDYAIYMLDPTGIVSSWNSGAQRFKGYTVNEILGHHFSKFYTDQDRATNLPARALDIAAREGRFEAEGWRVRKDGGHFWAHVVIDPIRDPQGRLIGYAKVTRDLSERKRAQEALKTSEEQFRLLVQGVADYAIYMLDPEGYVSNWNTGAQRIKGYTEKEIVGRHFSEFYTPEDREAGIPDLALETAAREGRFEKEGWRVRKDGTRFWANVIVDAIRDHEGRLLGFAKVTRDITERQQAQIALEQARTALFHSQKLEAVGQLTGGIAHDFNNLLTVIVNNLDMITRNMTDPRDLKRVEAAQRAAEHGAKLTQQLLAFSRRQPLRPETHNPNKLIGGFEAVLRRACGETIQFEAELAPRLKAAYIDSAQFEAALLNLVVNARDAMPNGGRLTVATDNTTIDAQRAMKMALPPGDYVVIAVTDTGTGMAPDVVPRVFEPFFTTKEIGKGTGLGLSQVYGFVTQSGGDVRIESEFGKGTTISLYLPATDGEASTEEEKRQVGAAPDTLGTVLIVEDEPDVLAIAIDLFRSLGYEPLTAGDAISALAILKREPNIDVLFSDVVMPRGMNGVELAREAQRLRPDLKVLLASGYPMSALSSKGLTDDTAFISKPYRWTELADKLRTLKAKV